MKIARTFHTCVLALVVVVAPQAMAAEQQRLMVQMLPLNAPPQSDIQLQAWSDMLPAMTNYMKDIQATHPKLDIPLKLEFFSAAVNLGETKYIISVPIFQCPAQSELPNEHDCTARVIEIKPGVAVRVIKEVPNFPIASIRGEAGYDASSNAQMEAFTTISLDPKSEVITVSVTEDNETDSNALIISLN